jgi:hypothetical protein
MKDSELYSNEGSCDSDNEFDSCDDDNMEGEDREDFVDSDVSDEEEFSI